MEKLEADLRDHLIAATQDKDYSDDDLRAMAGSFVNNSSLYGNGNEAQGVGLGQDVFAGIGADRQYSKAASSGNGANEPNLADTPAQSAGTIDASVSERSHTGVEQTAGGALQMLADAGQPSDGTASSVPPHPVRTINSELMPSDALFQKLFGGNLQDDNDAKSELSEDEKKQRVNSIRENYVKMITGAHALGMHVAADNLEHFMNGNGEPRTLPSDWLRSSEEIARGEDALKNDVMNTNLAKWVYAVPDGKAITKTDHWDKQIYATGYLSDLAYASGGSNLGGDVTMKLSRKGNIISAEGVYDINWRDRYHWTVGKSFDVPGFGTVKDEDGLFLQQYGGAKPFDMNSNWKLRFKGSYDLGAGKWASDEWSFAR